MNTPAPIDKTTKEPVTPIQRRRVTKRTREVLSMRIRKGYTWTECAERSGMALSSIFKAIKQPHVRALMLTMKEEYIQEVEELEKVHKARALEVARELMDESKSDAVKARMVEFLRGGTKGNGVNVAVQVNNQAPTGYEYARPDQEVVVIRDANSGSEQAGQSNSTDD